MPARDVTIVAKALRYEIYEMSFRGKKRGKFCLTREQMRKALNVERLHARTIEKLQDAALEIGMIIIDLDSLFPCINSKITRKYRRPPATIFAEIFPPSDNEEDISEYDDE